MRIPKRDNLEPWIRQQLDVCFQSHSERLSQYNIFRNLFLTGTPDGKKARYNRIWSYIDRRTSLLYSGEATVFEIDHRGKEARHDLMAQAMAARLKEVWSDFDCDDTAGEAIQWSQVYNTMFVKVLKEGDILVDPYDFAVYREDISRLDDQEMLVHRFYQTKEECWRTLSAYVKAGYISVEKATEAYLRIRTMGVVDDAEPLPPSIQTLIISATTPDIQGSIANPWDIRAQDIAKPYLDPDRIVRGHEIWIWDDEADDYRIIQFYDPGVIALDHANFYLKREHPFVKYTPNPVYNYFYGVSEVYFQMALQDHSEKRLEGIEKLLRRQEEPPVAVEGMMGALAQDVLDAFYTPRGVASLGSPNAKVHELKPDIGPDIWHDLEVNANMADEMGGIPPVLKGHGEKGVRSEGQAAKLMDVGASRIKKAALYLENSIEKHVNLRAKLVQKYDENRMSFLEDGKEEETHFVAAQFPVAYSVKISAHSASPVFVENLKLDAQYLFEKEVIDGVMLAEIMQFPQQNRIRALQKKKAEAAQQQAQQEQAKEAQEQQLKSIKGGKSA
jgi:hypothetical protein